MTTPSPTPPTPFGKIPTQGWLQKCLLAVVGLQLLSAAYLVLSSLTAIADVSHVNRWILLLAYLVATVALPVGGGVVKALIPHRMTRLSVLYGVIVGGQVLVYTGGTGMPYNTVALAGTLAGMVAVKLLVSLKLKKLGAAQTSSKE